MKSLMGNVFGRSLATLKMADSTHSFCTTSTVTARTYEKKAYTPSADAVKKIRAATKAVLDADQGKVKRPLAAWQIFLKEQEGKPRPEGTHVFTHWKTQFEELPAVKKEKYLAEAKKDQQRFMEEKDKTTERKRALTPYNIYIREGFASRPADMHSTAYFSILAAEYKQLNDQQRSKYVTAAREDAEQFRSSQPVVRKRPLTPYNHYLQEHMVKRADGESVRDAMKKSGAQWKALSANSKKRYEDLATEGGWKIPETKPKPKAKSV